MKEGVESKLKFKKLKRRLGLPEWQVIGLLESIWKLARTSAQQGDIGRHSNEDIAAAIEYDADHDELVSVLIDTGWLDEDPEFRLVIHDWSAHVPTYLRGNLKSRDLEFADVIAKRRANSGSLSGSLSGSANSEPLPSTVQPSTAKPSEAQASQTKPKDPPPPPPKRAPSDSQTEPEDPWEAVVAVLCEFGIAEWESIIEGMERKNLTPHHAKQVIDFWRPKRECWSSDGVLAWRLQKANLKLKPHEGWPKENPPNDVSSRPRKKPDFERWRTRRVKQLQKIGVEIPSDSQLRADFDNVLSISGAPS